MSIRDDSMKTCAPNLELAFPREEYQARLTRIRERLAYAARAAGSMKVLRDPIRPNLPVRELYGEAQ